MKRGLITLTLLFLLFSPIVLAANDTVDQTKEKLSALAGGLDEQTEDILTKEAPVPPVIRPFLKFIFGVDEGATWQELIVTLGVWIGFFILILGITGFFPFFKEDFVKFLVSIIITTLVSITGSLNIMATFFFDVAGFFEWTASWGPLQTIIAILLAGLTIAAVSWFSRKFRNKIKIGKAEETGRKLKEGSEDAEILSEGVEKIASKASSKKQS